MSSSKHQILILVPSVWRILRLICPYKWKDSLLEVVYLSWNNIMPKTLKGHRDAQSKLFTILFTIFKSNFQHVLTMWVTWWVSYKGQELLILREHLCSPQILCGVRVAHLFSFLCCVLWVFFALFIFVLCLVCPTFPVSLDCSFLIVPSVFSNVYFHP